MLNLDIPDPELERLFRKADLNAAMNEKVDGIFARTYPDGRCPAGEYIQGKGWVEFVDPEKEAKRRIKDALLPHQHGI